VHRHHIFSVPFSLRAALQAAAPVVLLLSACANPSQRAEKQGITPTYDTKTGKLTELAYDSDHDGRPDTWTRMDGSRALATRIDRNGDGKIDRWEEYDENGALKRVAFSRKDDGKPDAWATPAHEGALQRIESSSTGDEHRIDRWEYYAGAEGDGTGTLVRVEVDTKGDGKPHKWETYSGGALDTVAFDENGDGIADRRFTYRDSALVLIESKPDASGTFTVRTTIK
jgi:hypothetical protein